MREQAPKDAQMMNSSCSSEVKDSTNKISHNRKKYQSKRDRDQTPSARGNNGFAHIESNTKRDRCKLL